jgi:hypothetical protein
MAQISKFCQNGRYRIGKQTLGMVPVDDHFWPIPVVRPAQAPVTGIGHKRPFAGDSCNVRFPIIMETFEPISASQNDLFVGYVGFAISKRKKLAGSDFIAFCTIAIT